MNEGMIGWSWWGLALVVLARGADFVTTWWASPDLRHELNPVVRWLGWRRCIFVNIIICAGLGWCPLMAAIVGSCSVLCAASNCLVAIESAGRDARVMIGARTVLLLLLGVMMVITAQGNRMVNSGMGFGMVAYGLSGSVFRWVWRRGSFTGGNGENRGAGVVLGSGPRC